ILDIMRFLLICLIIFAHLSTKTIFPYIFDLSLSMYIIGVPFFFTASGFILEKKYNKDKLYFKKYITRLIKMYFFWSCIYFIFVLLKWLVHGVTTQTIIDYFHQSLVLTTYPTIWFLPALFIGASL